MRLLQTTLYTALTTTPLCALQRRTPPSPSLCANGFSDISLERLRKEQAEFVAERDWEQFHTPRSLALAMVGEVGEVCELFQWKGDDGAEPGLPTWTEDEKTALADELADVLSYVVRLSDVAGIDLPSAFLAKLDKNRAKYPSDVVKGSAAKYSTYGGQSPPAAVAGPSAPLTPQAPSEAVPADESGEREWGTPSRVSEAYARAAARFAAASGESPSAPSDTSGFAVTPAPPSVASESPQIEVPKNGPTLEYDASYAGSVQQRAAARAEAAYEARRRAALELEPRDAGGQLPPDQSPDQSADGEYATTTRPPKEVEVESLDELWGFMEFGDGSANWS